jgi:predicted O-linked N-acetylglucosamine transferase (SPINDLY family)
MHPFEPELAAALVAARGNDAEAALATALAAERAMPADARPLALAARALLRLGRPDEAADTIARAEALAPDAVPVLLERAAIARHRGAPTEARAALERLVELAPGHVPFRVDLALTCEAAGDLDAALAAWREALARAPRDPALAAGCGRCLLAAGQPDAAIPHLAVAVEADPGAPTVVETLVRALLAAGRPSEALAAIGRAARRAPGSAELARLELEVLRRSGASDEAAAAAAERLAVLLPAARGHEERAIEALRQWRHRDAHGALAAALAVESDAPLARWLALLMPPDLPHPDAAAEARFIARFREGLAELEPLAGQVTAEDARRMLEAATAFHVHYAGLPLTAELSRLGDVVSRLARRVVPQLAPFDAPRKPGRLRIGVCSSLLREHTVTRLFGGCIEALGAHPEVELHLLQPDGQPDAVTARLRAIAHDYAGGSAPLPAWAHAIRARELDLLIHLDVGMGAFTNALAALRLARTQACLWGHPVTTGLPTIDVFLSGEAMEPVDGDTHYRERLVRLPGLGATPTAPTRRPVPPPGLGAPGAGTVTAFMPQMLQKVDPGFDRALARIARGVSSLRFVFTPFMHSRPTRAWLRRLDAAFRDEGVDLRTHLRFCGWVDPAEWLGLAEACDFALDAFRWSGGQTTLEMLSLGLPVLTLPGALMRGRHSFAILSLLDLPELVARDEDDYVTRAIELARAAERRADLRARILERAPRLFDGADAARDFAARMVELAAEAAGR